MTTVTNNKAKFTKESFYLFERRSATGRKTDLSSYHYDNRLQKWLWFHIEGDTAYVSPYWHGADGFEMSTFVVGHWNYEKRSWAIDDIALSFNADWIAAQCNLSVDTSRTQKAYISFIDRELWGLDACKWFQAELKRLNALSDRIQIGLEFLKANTHLSEAQVFRFSKTGDIVGVALPKDILFNALLQQAIRKGKYQNIVSWHVPIQGVFPKKKRARKRGNSKEAASS